MGILDAPTYSREQADGRFLSLLKPSRVVLVVGLGQSNMEGRQRPYAARLNPTDARIQMWSWTQQKLVPAAVPLSSQQQQTGASPLSWIARSHLAAAGPESIVVVADLAAGGSGLVATPAQGTWAIDYAGSNPRLYSIALAELDKTIAAIQAAYNMVPEVWVYWHQGEADGSTTGTAYAAALDALINDLRSHLGSTTIPFTAGGLVPEYGGSADVTAALVNLPSRLEYVGYGEGVANGGDDLGLGVVHYTRQAGERLASNMFQAARRASIASAASVAQKPLDVAATLVSGTLTITWSAPLCRFTDFKAEYRIDGGAWTTITRSVACDLKAVQTGLSGSVIEARVSTVNGAQTSGTTIPVTAIGSGSGSVAAGTLLFRDEFNRADSSLLGYPWTVSATSGTPTGKVESNRGGVTGSVPTSSRVYAYVTPSQIQGTLVGTIVDLPTNRINMQLVPVMVDNNNQLFISAVSSSDGKYALYKRVSGSATRVVSATSAVIAAGDQVAVTFKNNILTVAVNAVTVITFDATGVLSGTPTRIGFGGTVETAGTVINHWDDLSFYAA